jgi:NADPH:quinone reductase-like Zn-dependent oxidoreductase
VVVDRGAEVTRFAIGDPVFARVDKERIGCFAERVAVDQREVARAPAAIDLVEAAALPLAGLTAYQALVELGQVAAGDRVFVQAGAGGVGSLAIQLAKQRGATVAATASAGKHGLLRSLGCDQPIDYHEDDYRRLLSGIAVVVDGKGGDEARRGFAVLRPGGLWVSLVGPPDPAFARDWQLGPLPRLAIRLISAKTRRAARRQGVRYRFWFMRPDGAQLAELAQLVDQGALRPVVDSIHDFTALPRAMAHAEAGHATGKVLIRGPDG